MTSTTQYIKNKVGYGCFILFCIITFLSILAKLAPERTPEQQATFDLEQYQKAQKRNYKKTLENTPIRDSILVDQRDSQIYRIRQFGNLWWMLDNLNFDTEDTIFFREQYVGRISIPSEIDASYGVYYDKISSKYAYPEGWRLPLNIEWKIMNEVYIRCHKKQDAPTGTYRMDSILLEPIWGGDYQPEKSNNRPPQKGDKFHHYISKQPSAYYYATDGYIHISKKLCNSSVANYRGNHNRYRLLSCRCVKEVE